MLILFALLAVAAAPSDCGLQLVLTPGRLVARTRQPLPVTATLVNRGPRRLTLVLPGDGSLEGDRTPTLEWLFDPPASIGTSFCANVNPLKRGEVFTLAPGASRELGLWIRPSLLQSPPYFSASLVYSNDPTTAWRGVPLRFHDNAELRRLRASDRCRVQSDPIQIVVE